MSAPNVEVLSFAAFEKLEADWDALVRGSAEPLPFLTQPWVRTWWRHFGEGLEFRCLAVRGNGGLLAAVPLAIGRRRVLGVPFRAAEIAGTGPVPTRGLGLADRADLVVRDGEDGARSALCAALVDQLRDVDALHLVGLPTNSPTTAALARVGARSWTVERSSSPYLTLAGNWEGYLQARSQRFRKQLKRSWRELGERGAVEVGREEGIGATLVAELVDIDRRSWKGRRGTGLLQHPRLAAFFSELLEELSRRGMVEVQVLRVAGAVAAYEIDFDLGGKIFGYNAGFSDALAACSPGNVVTAAVIRSAYERGRVEYDMLRGAEAYKARWGTGSRSEVELILPSARWRARLAARAGPWARARLRRIAWLVDLDDRLSGALNRLFG